MPRIKVFSIPEIFLYCVETKEYCEQNETSESFLPRSDFGEFLVNESKTGQILSYCINDYHKSSGICHGMCQSTCTAF